MLKVLSFGCRLNSFESEIIRKRLETAGFSDAVIIHTCAVTAEAERQARQAVRRVVKENPSAKIIVAGCSAQNSAGFYGKIPGVFAILGNREKLAESTYVKLAQRRDEPGPIMFAYTQSTTGEELEIAPNGFETLTKALVQIQKGCMWNCSYCIVPLVRGPHKSFSEEAIATQITDFLAQGYKEIVLTGVDIASYGVETGTTLADLTQKILNRFPTIERLRLSSLDPAKNYDSMLELMKAEQRIMPHLHLSVQSGNNEILKSMHRRHNAQDVEALVNKARAALPDIAIGADIIVGFPGETEENFMATYSLIESLKISHLHAFAYSKREGTAAASMQEHLDVTTKKIRINKLIQLGNKLEYEYIKSQIGKFHNVLVEKNNMGYTENYIQVKIEGAPLPPNSICKVLISTTTGKAGEIPVAKPIT
jgi:threonylcarbamoyladenosine tRNA methylthiotransferase MtaB